MTRFAVFFLKKSILLPIGPANFVSSVHVVSRMVSADAGLLAIGACFEGNERFWCHRVDKMLD